MNIIKTYINTEILFNRKRKMNCKTYQYNNDTIFKIFMNVIHVHKNKAFILIK